MIKLVNVKFGKLGGVVYVGRKCGGYGGSVLGNPFKIGVDGDRDEVIRKYKVWLWNEYKKGGSVKDEIDKLVVRYKKGEEIVLGCWCVPKKCHGEIIRNLIIYLSK